MSIAPRPSVSPKKSRALHGPLPASCPSMPPVLLGSIRAQPGMQLAAHAMKGSIAVSPGMQPAKNANAVHPRSPTLQSRSINGAIASPKLSDRASRSPKLPRDSAFRSPLLQQSLQARRHSDTSALRQRSPMSRPRGFSDSGLPWGSPLVAQTPNISSGDLHVGSCVDPVQDPSLKSEIFAKLGLPQSAQINRLSNNCGGLNQGVWIIQESSSQQTLVMKLVGSQGTFGRSEAEKLNLLGRKFPSLASDDSVAFLVKVFSCIDPTGKHWLDFIVMRKVAGKPVGDVIGYKWNAGQKADAMKILRELGSFLAQFHKRYANSQHCDFQPSNVFYDALSGKFAMIDIADLGDQSRSEGDVKHFVQSLRLLSGAYGEQFYNDGKRNFEEGYKHGMR